jgi:hypothetical protein
LKKERKNERRYLIARDRVKYCLVKKVSASTTGLTSKGLESTDDRDWESL